MLVQPVPTAGAQAAQTESADREVLQLAAANAASVEVAPIGPLTLPVLENSDDQPVDLNRIFSGRGVLMSFYSGGWSQPCIAGLADLEAFRPALENRGWGIVGVSPESVGRLAATRERQRLGFLLVHDHGARFAASLGLAHRLPAGARAALRATQVRLADWNGEASAQLPVAASLLVAEDRSVATFLHTEPRGGRTDVKAAIRAALG